jgi:diacylglycerol kinase family enzyme
MVQTMPELCVIFNPAAGRGRAGARLEKLRRDWGSHVEFQPTSHPGHADALAERAAQRGFTIVAAAGGDGTVHEVTNGILRANRPEVDFAVIPIGSANDYAHSLAWNFPERNGAVHSVDVGRVQAANGRERFFVCCLGLGLNGAVTLESRRIRRLQGLALYGLATLRALWYHYGCPDMELAFDDQPPVRLPTLMLSVLVARREGGFVMAPEARLDDGWLDYVHSGALSRLEVLRFLPRLALSGPPSDHPKVRLGRCRRVRLRSSAPLIVHVDGEFFCRPEDRIQDLDIEILPAALRVRTRL